MKIIDLLNLIAKGEEVPKYIKYYNRSNNKRESMLCCKENIIYKLDQFIIDLNDEIIEEEKEIEECKSYECFDGIDDYIEHLRSKINELKDVINEMRRRNDNNNTTL